MGASTERSGLMVVRIWSEEPAGTIRARLTQTLDLSRPRETVRTAGSLDQVVGLVREWGEAFSEQARVGPPPPGTSPGR